MEFESKAHENAYERINKMMLEIYGKDDARFSDDRPHWMLKSGSAVIHISIMTWVESMHIVSVTAYVANGTEITPSCMRYLLEENNTMVFGGFAIDSDGDIAFEHSLIAETCNQNELKTVIQALRNTADEFDDKIVERWGGKRAVD